MVEPRITGNPRRQHGAAAIEFAAFFMIFFVLFYAMVAYSLPLLLSASYQEIAANALRDTLATQAPGTETAPDPTYTRSSIEQAWLPVAWLQPCNGYGDQFLRVTGDLWSVCVAHNSPQTLFPVLSAFGVSIPSLPEQIRGEASIQRR